MSSSYNGISGLFEIRSSFTNENLGAIVIKDVFLMNKIELMIRKAERIASQKALEHIKILSDNLAKSYDK